MPNEVRDKITYPSPTATAARRGSRIDTQFYDTPYDICNYVYMPGYYEIDIRCLFLDVTDVVNIGSDCGLVPSGNKSLYVPIFTHICVVKWRH